MNKICSGIKIPYTYGESIKLKPIFDVHYGSTLCDVRAFKKFLEDSDDKTYFIGGGDLLDSIVVTDKRYTKNIDAMETEEILDEQIDGLYSILEPYKERIIGTGLGNHEYTILKKCNTNPIKRLAEKLGTEYLGYSWFYKLTLSEKNSRGRTVIIYGNHGYGGGSRTQGADLTKYSKDTSYYSADIFMYGHVHRLQFDEIPRLGIVGNKLIAKPKVLVICGSFKKSLSDDTSVTWEQTCGFPPTKIGGPTISIKPNSTWCDISVSL